MLSLSLSLYISRYHFSVHNHTHGYLSLQQTHTHTFSFIHAVCVSQANTHTHLHVHTHSHTSPSLCARGRALCLGASFSVARKHLQNKRQSDCNVHVVVAGDERALVVKELVRFLQLLKEQKMSDHVRLLGLPLGVLRHCSQNASTDF